MAYIDQGYNQNDDDEQNNQNSQGPTTTGQGGFVQSGNQSNQSNARGGTGFVNFQNYVDANQNKSSGLAENIGQNVQGSVDQAKSKLSDTYQNFQNQSNQNKLFDTSNIRSNIQNNNFSGLSQNQNWNRLGGGYQGPSQLVDQSGYQAAQNARNQAEGKLDQIGSSEGRTSLLKDTVKDPTYRAGETMLDSALLTGDSQARQTLDSFLPQREALKSFYDTKIDSAENTYNQNQADWDSTAQNLQNMLNTQGTQFRSGLSQAAQDRTAQAQREYDRARDRYLNEGVSANIMTDDGREVGLYDSRVSAEPFFQRGKTDYNVADIASQEQVAQLRALESLGLDPFAIGQAQGEMPSYQFDEAGYAQAMQEQYDLNQAEQAALAAAEREKELAAAVAGASAGAGGNLSSGGNLMDDLFGGLF